MICVLISNLNPQPYFLPLSNITNSTFPHLFATPIKKTSKTFHSPLSTTLNPKLSTHLPTAFNNTNSTFPPFFATPNKKKAGHPKASDLKLLNFLNPYKQ